MDRIKVIQALYGVSIVNDMAVHMFLTRKDVERLYSRLGEIRQNWDIDNMAGTEFRGVFQDLSDADAMDKREAVA